MILADGEDEDFIVREKLKLDGLGEGDDVKLFPEEGLIIHGAKRRVIFLGSNLCHISVNSRSGGHVEAFIALDEIRIVDFHKIAFLLIIKSCTRRAMGLVLIVMALVDFISESLGIGSGWVAEFVGEGLDDVIILLPLLAHLAIGADGEGMEGSLTLLSPLGEGLGKEGEAGDEEEDALPFA